jgi:hypothetical protein
MTPRRQSGTLACVKRITVIIALIATGCASFHSSHVLLGTARPAIDPSQVKIFLNPPQGAEEVAIVTADSRGSFRWSSQGTTDLALERLKKEAAGLGANGLTKLSIGEPWGAAPVVGTGVAYGWGGYPAGYGLGTSLAMPAPFKSATALAIRVREE